MSSRNAEEEGAADLLERRWFASMAAARTKQAECEALLEVMALAKASGDIFRAALHYCVIGHGNDLPFLQPRCRAQRHCAPKQAP
jgi:hypothetical protein